MLGGFNFLRILLFPISVIYGMVISVRNFLFETNIFKSKEYDLPIISIGNLAVGGTGKTPHVEYILNLLNDKHKTAMISRGYKRKTKGLKIANSSDTSKTIGDEPYQIKNKFPMTTVAVDSNRQQAIERLSDIDNFDAIILDDAFQHRKVTPGLNILLTDFNHPFTKDHFLPYGRLRDHKHEHRRAHIIIVTKCPKDIKPIQKRIIQKELKLYPFQFLFFTNLEYGKLTNIFDPTITLELSEVEKHSIIGVSGIANNKHFKGQLHKLGENVKTLHYLDHHDYTKRDVQRIQTTFNQLETKDKIIITTEKDAVKLKNVESWDNSMKKNVFFLPIKIAFLGVKEQENEFKQQILEYVKTNRRYSKLYKGQDLN